MKSKLIIIGVALISAFYSCHPVAHNERAVKYLNEPAGKTLGEIDSIIENSDAYMIAKKTPNKINTAMAMDFILNKSGVREYFDSLNDLTKHLLSEYIGTLYSINEKEISDPENKISYQLLGSRLHEAFGHLVIRGVLGNGQPGKDLKRLTNLVMNITIPIAQ
ncbi:hypothetical protein DVR12_14475 [Chitinophaga silvatica]|uniref:Uncharacterized protein n=1 Tax=Chitinophaga silvatica TaxID=2282649 RepID=A0A3E1Y8X2_9BACT|nr:hypothetical protein [Chitinophaga silvatica]RFS21857.1 hypothetical protein DVR12_14475 [Chitinophaga silvatica]